MNIQNVTDASFKKYGKVLEGYPVEKILKEMQHTPLPNDVIYVPSAEALEAVSDAEVYSKKGFGGMQIQIGYCNGNNHQLNGLEYHRSSEINIAVNDLILILGEQTGIGEDFTYDTAKTEAFMVPAGTAVEVYATTLHYAPCNAKGQNGFRCVIILPKGTNDALTFTPDQKGEDKLLAARNKWLIAHEEAAIEGAFNGLTGKNITLA